MAIFPPAPALTLCSATKTTPVAFWNGIRTNCFTAVIATTPSDAAPVVRVRKPLSPSVACQQAKRSNENSSTKTRRSCFGFEGVKVIGKTHFRKESWVGRARRDAPHLQTSVYSEIYSGYRFSRSFQILIEQPVGDQPHSVREIVAAIGMFDAEILRHTVKLINL